MEVVFIASVHQQGLTHFCLMLREGLTFRIIPRLSGAVAMAAAGVTDKVWGMADVAALIAAQEAPIAKRGAYKKKAA